MANAGISHWLQSLQLPQYIHLFHNAGYTSLIQCANLTEVDLDKLGIILSGHRKRILLYLPSDPSDFPPASQDKPHYVNLDNKVAESQHPEEPILCNTAHSSSNDSLTDVTCAEDLEKDIYQVPPHPLPVRRGEHYENIDYSEKSSPAPPAPNLPPKRKTSMESIDERLSIVSSSVSDTDSAASSPSQGKRPIPMPRRTLVASKPTPKPRNLSKDSSKPSISSGVSPVNIGPAIAESPGEGTVEEPQDELSNLQMDSGTRIKSDTRITKSVIGNIDKEFNDWLKTIDSPTHEGTVDDKDSGSQMYDSDALSDTQKEMSSSKSESADKLYSSPRSENVPNLISPIASFVPHDDSVPESRKSDSASDIPSLITSIDDLNLYDEAEKYKRPVHSQTEDFSEEAEYICMAAKTTPQISKLEEISHAPLPPKPVPRGPPVPKFDRHVPLPPKCEGEPQVLSPPKPKRETRIPPVPKPERHVPVPPKCEQKSQVPLPPNPEHEHHVPLPPRSENEPKLPLPPNPLKVERQVPLPPTDDSFALRSTGDEKNIQLKTENISDIILAKADENLLSVTSTSGLDIDERPDSIYQKMWEYKSCDIPLSNSSTLTRDDFNAPPPTFAPPPLPPIIAESPSPSPIEPPAVPPRLPHHMSISTKSFNKSKDDADSLPDLSNDSFDFGILAKSRIQAPDTCSLGNSSLYDSPQQSLDVEDTCFKKVSGTDERADVASKKLSFISHGRRESEENSYSGIPFRSSSKNSIASADICSPAATSSPFFLPDHQPGSPYPFSPKSEYSMENESSGGASAFDHSTQSAWESDDTLSDGGDFLDYPQIEPPSLDKLKAAIPIVPAVQLSHFKVKHSSTADRSTRTSTMNQNKSQVTSRKGYLYKLASKKSKRLGFVKRWVTFGGEELRYFVNNKTLISKRIIPVKTMHNVEQITKAEQHGYRFNLTTIDRVYQFATDDADNLALWTSLLMKAIIDRGPTGEIEDGLDLANPDKKGFLKMEDCKAKRYLAIKADKFCFYNTPKDFCVGTPIHCVDMKLASVKDSGRLKLQLMTPQVSFMFDCESRDELEQWKAAFEESTAEGLSDDNILNEVVENHSNRVCADCRSPNAHWASINLAVVLCKECAGIHRQLSMPTSKIRSLRLDYKVWTPGLINMLKEIGNDHANTFWEWNITEDDRIRPKSDMASRQDFILCKYSDLKFARLHPLHKDEEALNKALCKSVQYGDVLETMQLVFSGADILCTTSEYTTENNTPLTLAKKSRQTLQMEFLLQNGAEGSGKFPTNNNSIIMRERVSMIAPSRAPTKKGYLYKTGPNHRGEFLKRWCVLQHAIFSYYENEKQNIAKDTIEGKEMLTVVAANHNRDRYEFELGTTKSGGRNYLFAAECEGTRKEWIEALAKSIAPIASRRLDKIQDIDRGGVVFLKFGNTEEWKVTWIHLVNRTLFVYKKEEDTFDEIDLRKIQRIMMLQRLDNSGCSHAALEASDPFVIYLPISGKGIHIHATLRRETDSWYNALRRVSTVCGSTLEEMQLTTDDIPVLVDRCINFVDLHGLSLEGIYRLNGQHSKITGILEEFTTDARDVHLSAEVYQIHDVATALKRFFRSLSDPVLTREHHNEWVSIAGQPDIMTRLQRYKYLLGNIPDTNYSTLKKVISHLSRVVEHESDNKMTVVNVASIFGPVLMTLDKEWDKRLGYGQTNQEIGVIKDLIENHQSLFEVKDEERERERKIEDAIERIQSLSNQGQAKAAGNLKVSVYLNNKNGKEMLIEVSGQMTAEELLDEVIAKESLNVQSKLGVFEVICGSSLERPIHYSENVLDVTLRWGSWPEEFRKANYLCIKDNYVFRNIVFEPQLSLFSELRFSEKKSFRKFYFEFSQYRISYQRDTKTNAPIQSWNVEDLMVYIGCQPKRSPPSKWSFTFITRKDPVQCTRDIPFFGHTVCCNTAEELYKWLSTILRSQHQDGLEPGEIKSHPRPPPTPSVDLAASVPSPVETPYNKTRTSKHSIIQRIMNKR